MQHSLLLHSLLPILLLIAAALPSLPLVHGAASPLAPTPNSVTVSGTTLLVDGVKFTIKGLAYSPVPIGADVNQPPHGDYFTPDYAYLWKRDLAAIAGMGVNTIRIYNFNTAVNHAPFLDTCYRMGLKVLLTHYLGDSTSTPIDTEANRQAAIDAFSTHVRLYGDHPAILVWSIGNEVNGPWLGFKDAINTAFSCNWDQSCEGSVEARCATPVACIYGQLFKWIDNMAAAAKQFTTRPITSAFADVDNLIGTDPSTDRIPRFNSLLPHIDLYTVQIYRGHTFGAYFTQFAAETTKPLLVGEFGVDSYNDPCGWPENAGLQPCFNLPAPSGPDNPGGSEVAPGFVGCQGDGLECKNPGVTSQAKWDSDLANEFLASPVVAGGILVSWQDENWKGIGVQDFCKVPCPHDQWATCSDPNSDLFPTFQMGGTAGCAKKAHITCSDYDTNYHDLCGYYLPSAPDAYVNEEWFGMNAVTDCGASGDHGLGALTPRPVVQAISTIYGGTKVSLATSPISCDDLGPCFDCTQSNSVTDISRGACDSVCNLQFKGTIYNGTLVSQAWLSHRIHWWQLLVQLIVGLVFTTYLTQRL